MSMYIHNRDEALDALSEVLALPERRDQIIQMTVKVMVCLDPDARNFMVDCAAGLIEGGLEFMKNKRREMLEAAQQEGGEAILIVDSSQDQLIEAVGMAMDAMRMAEVVAQVFPELGQKHEKWEIGRAVLGDEKTIQDAAREAVKERKKGATDVRAGLQREVAEKIAAARAPWFESWAKVRQAVEAAMGDGGNASADPELIFRIVALDDTRAQLVLDLSTSDPSGLKDYIKEVRSRVDQLAALAEKQG